MSFYINNTELDKVFFNGSEVNTVYLNNVLVWDGASWKGWANATWKDIYRLCQAKQTGKISAWPDDVVIGATKTTKLSTNVLGFTSIEMVLIDIDKDGDGVLTFQSKTASTTEFAYGSYGSLSNVENNCNLIYEYCDAKTYIKPINKTWLDFASWSDKTKASNVWVLSKEELSGTAAYAYYTAGNSMAKNKPYWTRSYQNKNNSSHTASLYYVETYNGFSTMASTYDGICLSPAFAIG